MVLMGQAAGAASVDMLNFAFAADPIVKGFITESAVALMAHGLTDPNHTNFSYVAGQMGCPANSTGEEELECMRMADAEIVEGLLEQQADFGPAPALYFAPVRDGELVFGPVEYRAKGAAGNFSKLVSLVVFGLLRLRSVVSPHAESTGTSRCCWAPTLKMARTSCRLPTMEQILHPPRWRQIHCRLSSASWRRLHGKCAVHFTWRKALSF